MQKFYHISKIVYESIVGIALLITIFAVVFQVLCRYVFHIAAPWTEELARYAMLAITFLGTVVVSRTGNHLGAFFLVDRASGRLKGLILVLSNIVVIGFLYFMIIGGWSMIPLTYNALSTTMPFFRMAYIYYGLVFGSVFMAIYSIKDLALSVKLLIDGKDENLPIGKSTPFAEED